MTTRDKLLYGINKYLGWHGTILTEENIKYLGGLFEAKIDGVHIVLHFTEGLVLFSPPGEISMVEKSHDCDGYIVQDTGHAFFFSKEDPRKHSS